MNKNIKASIYCGSCGAQNIIESPVEGMEVHCKDCSKPIVLKKKSGTASQRLRSLETRSTTETPSGRVPPALSPGAIQNNLVEANLRMMNKLEELENKISKLQQANLVLQKQLTQKQVEAKQLSAVKDGEFQGKSLLEAILLEVKDQKAGQELSQALQRKDADTLYKTINAMMLEIYEIKQEFDKIKSSKLND